MSYNNLYVEVHVDRVAGKNEYIYNIVYCVINIMFYEISK